MDYRVILTEQAIHDLRDIVKFVAKDDPTIADKLGNSLIDSRPIFGKIPLTRSRRPENRGPDHKGNQPSALPDHLLRRKNLA